LTYFFREAKEVNSFSDSLPKDTLPLIEEYWMSDKSQTGRFVDIPTLKVFLAR